MAMGHKTSWRVFVATFVVAVGAALIWGFAGGWLITLVENHRPDVYENINVAADGTPVICVETNTSSGTIALNRHARW